MALTLTEKMRGAECSLYTAFRRLLRKIEQVGTSSHERRLIRQRGVVDIWDSEVTEKAIDPGEFSEEIRPIYFLLSLSAICRLSCL